MGKAMNQQEAIKAAQMNQWVVSDGGYILVKDSRGHFDYFPKSQEPSKGYLEQHDLEIVQRRTRITVTQEDGTVRTGWEIAEANGRVSNITKNAEGVQIVRVTTPAPKATVRIMPPITAKPVASSRGWGGVGEGEQPTLPTIPAKKGRSLKGYPLPVPFYEEWGGGMDDDDDIGAPWWRSQQPRPRQPERDWETYRGPKKEGTP